MKRLPTKFVPQVREAFLKRYRECGILSRAVEGLQISFETPRAHAKRDPEFKERMDAALQGYRDSLEAEAHRRGVEGIPRSVYYKGEVVGEERQYSDRILELQLKRHIPEYRDKFALDVAHAGGILVVHKVEQSSKEWEDTKDAEKK